MNVSDFILYLFTVYLIWKYVFNTPDYVTYYAKFSFYIICMAIIPVLLIPAMLISPRNLRNFYMLAQTMLHVSKVLGVTWTLRNEKVLAGKMSAVVIGNHQSTLDILGVFHFTHLTKRFAPVSKKEILYLFPFGLVAYLMGCVFIDRKNPKDAYKTLEASAKDLFINKYKIGMYPEGTRNMSGKMLPFKKGAFSLAIACQVPIIPVITSPYYFLDSEKCIFRKGQVIIQCLEAVPTAGLTMDDLPNLKDSIQKMMQDTYDELTKEMATMQKLQDLN